MADAHDDLVSALRAVGPVTGTAEIVGASDQYFASLRNAAAKAGIDVTNPDIAAAVCWGSVVTPSIHTDADMAVRVMISFTATAVCSATDEGNPDD